MDVAVREPVAAVAAGAVTAQVIVSSAAAALRAAAIRNRIRTATVRSRHCWVETADRHL
jgi:hypothetical protein